MRIDVWSDVVCPWCYIGFVRLEKAIDQLGLEVELYHHAYQLDKDATQEPYLAVENLAEKYGIPVEAAIEMMGNVSSIAESEGLHYQLDKTYSANTELAHRLLMLAAERGVHHDLLFKLFNAYFEKAEKIFSVDDLKPFAESVGISTQELQNLANSDTYMDVMQSDKELAEQLNVRGVPFFVFNQRVAVAGAETTDLFVQAMQRAMHEG
jgi:predicted DsbA family dithiol-disulfide isomerase